MDQSFIDIITSIDYDCYFDSEAWFKNVLKTKYDIITNNGFGILIEYRSILGRNVGHSRGGIRFDKSTKTIDEYRDFVEYLKRELRNKRFSFIGIDHCETPSEFTESFEKSDVREHIRGTALIYPTPNWIGKFNSKKRYDLVYAGKKGVKVAFYTNDDAFGSIPDEDTSSFTITKTDELPDDIFEKFHDLVQETIKRHGNRYPVPDKETFRRMFTNTKFVLSLAVSETGPLAYTLCFFNPNRTALERVFAGAREEGLRFRAPSFIEITMVNLLSRINLPIYDLWGIKEGDGFTEFKKSLADEVKQFAQYSIIKADPAIANLSIFLIKLSRRLKEH